MRVHEAFARARSRDEHFARRAAELRDGESKGQIKQSTAMYGGKGPDEKGGEDDRDTLPVLLPGKPLAPQVAGQGTLEAAGKLEEFKIKSMDDDEPDAGERNGQGPVKPGCVMRVG